MHPASIFPDAQSVIVLGFRIPRGCFRGIEEGTYFAAYPAMGYAGINLVYAPIVLREVTLFLEDRGFEVVPVQNMNIGPSIVQETGEERKGFSIPVAPDRPAPDVMIHFRIAAVAAGLGEIGYSGLFLSPQFGPRQRLALLITDAPLKPDPLFEGKICDRCMKCVEECSGKAISRDEVVRVKVAGKVLEWGKLDPLRCSIAYTGGTPETSPFLPPNIDFEMLMKEGFYGGRLLAEVPYNRASLNIFHHNPAIEGARGCIRACMIHLEQTGRIEAKFRHPFRKRNPWSLPKRKP
jgi:ferredoxin